MNTREKAARALYELEPVFHDLFGPKRGWARPWGEATELHDRCFARVDAVLNAIREPTIKQRDLFSWLFGVGAKPFAHYVQAWQAMIDSISNGEG